MAQQRMGVFGRGGALVPDWLLLPAGVALMLALTLAGMRGRYRLAARGLWLWAALSLAVVALVLVTGQRFRGAVYGAGFVTPTELLKLTAVLFTAAFVERHGRRLARWRGALPPLAALWPLLAVWTLLVALLLVQRDLGLVLILALALLAMLGAGTGQVAYPLLGLALGAAGGWAVLGLFSHGQRRIQAWLDPFADATGSGWQVLQGLSGMHAGGLWGAGFGEARPRYAPIAESDFIYAVLAEELGFAGAALLMVMFALLLLRLIAVAARARTPFGLTAAAGVAAVLSVQTLLNLGGVTKALPLTGVTLPLISHGGSSLLTVLASLALVLAISDGEPPRRAGGRATKAAPRKAAGRSGDRGRPHAHAKRRRGG
jgi:cell division protein FtsW (lipid II flippase)